MWSRRQGCSIFTEASTPTLLASTSEVYGLGQGRPFRETDDSVYGPTTVARWSYAHSKAVDEHLAFAFEQELPGGCSFFPLVLVNVVIGAWFCPDRESSTPSSYQNHGDGKRRAADVRDIVDSLPKLLRSSDARGLPVNLGHDEPITILALAELVRDVLNSESSIQILPYKEFGAVVSGSPRTDSRSWPSPDRCPCLLPDHLPRPSGTSLNPSVLRTPSEAA